MLRKISRQAGVDPKGSLCKGKSLNAGSAAQAILYIIAINHARVRFLAYLINHKLRKSTKYEEVMRVQ